jgi:hypothetical protein
VVVVEETLAVAEKVLDMAGDLSEQRKRVLKLSRTSGT